MLVAWYKRGSLIPNLSIVMKFMINMILNCPNRLFLSYNYCLKDIFSINFNK